MRENEVRLKLNMSKWERNTHFYMKTKILKHTIPVRYRKEELNIRYTDEMIHGLNINLIIN
jgi:hypothetical protein